MPEEKTTPEPAPGEKTSAQAPSVVPGFYGLPLGALGLFGSAYGGYGWPVGPAAALVGTNPPEGINRYNTLGYAGMVDGGVIPGPIVGGSGPIWPGTYAIYRIMSAHPTIALTAAVLAAAVLGTDWSFEHDDDAPDGADKVIQKAIEPLRVQLVLDCLRSLALGWSGFEAIYESRKGMILPARFKYLLPEKTEILVTDKGGLVGLKQDKVRIGPGKALVYTNDRDGDNYYGRSRHENCRRAWSNYMMFDDHLATLGDHAKGPVPLVRYPDGEGRDEYGNVVHNSKLARSVANGAYRGRPVIMPNLAGATIGDLSMVPELAKASTWDISTLDLGNAGGTMQGMLAVIASLDARLVRGWLVPERAVLEAQKGGLGQGDSQNHGSLGLSNADLILGSIIRFTNDCIINPILEWNYGPEVVGKVYAKAAPRDPEKLEFFQSLATAMMANPQGLPQLIGNIDANVWMDALNLPKKTDKVEFDTDELKPPPPPVKPDPNNPQDKLNNSNGQAKAKPANRFG